MLSRTFLALILVLTLAVSASSQNLLTLSDSSLRRAAQQLKVKEYRGAWTTALSAPESPERSFMAGTAALRLEQWTDAAELLGRAAKDLPLLADYALVGQAEALKATARYDEALGAVNRLIAAWPESPVIRRGRLLQADILFARNNFREALDAYVRFIESYPSGVDSLTATYQAALCREGLGDDARAVQEFRNLWITYPASSVAEKAEESLKRIARKGIAVEPYSADDLFRRGCTLYNLGKYEQALKAFDAISLSGQSADFTLKTTFKSGQSLFKARHYRDAARIFASLLDRELKPVLADDVRFWLARTLDKCGKEDEAVATFLAIPAKSSSSELADDALLEAAFVRKFQGRYREQLPLLEKILATSSDPKLTRRAAWEAAWARYNQGDFKGAAEGFKSLLPAADYRVRALYWHGRALESAGDREGASRIFATLADEEPLSFYTSLFRKHDDGASSVSLQEDITLHLPIPLGFERVKTLISFGLHDEARRELAANRKNGTGKKKSTLALARLYLEMDDYASAAALVRSDPPRRITADSLVQWGLLYPRAFRDAVTERAASLGVPEELVFSLMKAESGFAPGVVSPVGAVGLMQLMPTTAKTLVANGAKNGIAARLVEPDFNISLGVRHLRDLLKQYNGNIVSAVAAYNAGSNAVDRWRKSLTYRSEDEFIENIPYYETREYVKKVLAGSALYRRLYRPQVAPPAANAPSPQDFVQTGRDEPDAPPAN
ncbi:transglycosylase SLT domain-containing protein [Geobacter pickeringii]|uniref:transglycosylase SLT domain-containing protein n=1 Tax=Geobacter pickeringii TaxID=345632 RepID=UPI00068A8B2C|nr:transglycosylase SLT domain-containing protein [Geobacter pickeringii]